MMQMFRYPQITKYATLFLLVALGGLVLIGGQILSIDTRCVTGLFLEVGPPNGGTFMFTAGSRLFSWYTLRPGVWVLGIAAPGGVCVIPRPDHSALRIPTVGTVMMIGTSK